MKVSLLSALTLLVTFALPACGGPGSTESDVAAGELNNVPGRSVRITNADKEAVDKGVKLYLRDPKISEGAAVALVSQDSWEGTHNLKWVVKDTDGRLFSVMQVSSRAEGELRHGSTPNLELSTTSILLDKTGIDYVIASHDRKQTTRHKQILGYKNNPDFPDTYKELGTLTIDGSVRTLIPFAGMLFAVKAAGFDDRCKASDEVPECAAAWERINTTHDPFDVGGR